MSRHIAFVTTEYDPIVPGGAGAVVAGLTRRLRELGNRVTIILVTDRAVEGVGEDVLVTPPSGNGEDAPALAASKAAFEAVRRLVDSDRIDLIEFQDFDGLGFWTVTHRHDTPLESTLIAIRYHLPADHILDAIGAARPEFDAVRAMERAALRGADAVIAQTPSMAGVIHDRYGIEPERIIAGPPPVLEVGNVSGPRSPAPRFVVVGRLSEQKGDHDCIRALGPVLERHRDVTIEFVGADGWSASEDLPMREWIPTLAPPDVRDRIVFTDPVPRTDLPSHLSGTWAVLVPSRLESFCLAAHEARAMGLPIIARDLEPITDYFDETTGALIYDGTDAGLRDAVENVIEHPAILDQLAAAPIPAYPDPASVYLGELPAPRHPHSQAGHATAGIHGLESATAVPPPRRRGRDAARKALALLPERVARTAVRLVPGRLKDRFRDVASWPAEMERRRLAERRLAVERQIAGGDFPELDDPRVTVVIPCYNHGTYVEGAILTVFEQAFRSWEIVVVDDGSTDPETVRTLDALDLPRVRVLRQPNTGLPGARNAGISAARGELIVPLDADDELLPRYMAELVDALDGEPRAAFAHCWAELFGDVNWVWATRPYNPYTVLLSNSVLQVAMFRRSAWDQVGGYDPTMTHGNEDWDLWLRFQEAGWTNVRIREPLYRYRKHGTSMSVDTEADFERGRERIRRRHPALYDPALIRRSKAAHYPTLTVIAAPEVTIDPGSFRPADVQIVNAGTDRCGTVGASTGKYVVFWEGSPIEDLWLLVERLERYPHLGAVTDGREIVYRRWELVDPDTGLELGGASPPERCPDPRWIVPSQMDVDGRTLDVVRQRPEEEGFLPRWLES